MLIEIPFMLFNLRPHHLLCNLCFQGKGYNEEFTANFNMIHQALKNQQHQIKITQGIDDICAKCPKKQGLCCEDEVMVTELDQAYLKTLQLHYNEIISIAIVKNNIKTLLSLARFRTICAPCSWYSTCTKAIQHITLKDSD